MKVMVIVKATADSEAGVMPSQELLAAMGNYNEELVNAGIMLAGEGLHPSSKGARVRFDGANRTVVSGPFAETKELIAGYWLWNVNSLDEAIAWVKRCPNPMPGPSEIEIRQVFSADDFGPEFTPELREQEAAVRAKSLGLGAIRFELLSPLTVAGLNRSYTPETRGGIPAQWLEFAPRIGHVPGQSPGLTTYGVSWNFRGPCDFDYLCGVALLDPARRPADLTPVEIPGGRYVVFTHSGHVSQLPQMIETIFRQWAPDCGLKLASGLCFERYTEEFNPQTGRGGTEFWLRLESP